MSLREVSGPFSVSDLAWLFEGPGLLCAETFGPRLVNDESLVSRGQTVASELASLAIDPSPLTRFLQARVPNGRLGRYFEDLVHYYFREMRRPPKLETNLQVRGPNGQTLGEFDLLFCEEGPSEHWEMSVKFYICTTPDPKLAQNAAYFMGTLVKDRLDRKLETLFAKQLRLSEKPAARSVLETRGFTDVTPRALLKGFFFYPAGLDWRRHPYPPEVSPKHLRGWWTTADRFDLVPRKDRNSRYVVLPFTRWFGPMRGRIDAHELLTWDELRSRVTRLFDSSWARPINYEMMVAEVCTEGLDVQERSRGTILQPAWPAHAIHSLDGN